MPGLQALSHRPLLLGRSSATRSLREQLSADLRRRDLAVTMAELEHDCCESDLARISQILSSSGCDAVVAAGGGKVLDAVMLRTNAFARIAVCGMIAGYNGEPLAMTNPTLILKSRMTIEGFIVSEHMEVWPEALAELAELIASGKFNPRQTIAQGLASAPEAFMGLLKGHNFGKQVVKLI